MADHPSNLTHNEVRDLLMGVAEAHAEHLTELAVAIRERPQLLYTSGAVADILTTTAAGMLRAAERAFAKDDE